MISNKTIVLAQRLDALHKELNQSILDDSNGKARLCYHGDIQITFASPYDMDEKYLRSVLPEIDWTDESTVFKHLHYKVGGVPFVTLVYKEVQLNSDVGTDATT